MMSLQLYSEFAVDSMMQQRENEIFFDIYHKPIRKCKRYKGLLVWKYLEKRSMKLGLYYSNKNIQEILHRSLNIDCKQN